MKGNLRVWLYIKKNSLWLLETFQVVFWFGMTLFNNSGQLKQFTTGTHFLSAQSASPVKVWWSNIVSDEFLLKIILCLGEYLFSGGSEKVMVKWRLGMSRKQFLPRMGSTIKFIVNAPDNVCVATSHSDNGNSQSQLMKFKIQTF